MCSDIQIHSIIYLVNSGLYFQITKMNVNLLLRKKRDGEEITKDEIGFFVSGLVNGEVAESQIGK